MTIAGLKQCNPGAGPRPGASAILIVPIKSPVQALSKSDDHVGDEDGDSEELACG
jgi:hypothetical protein